MSRSVVTALACLAVVVATGCGAEPPSRSGADVEPVTLTATSYVGRGRPGADALLEFARQVERLSDGAMEITIGPDPDNSRPDTSAEAIAEVRKGRYDVGLVATRSFDSLGVLTMQALQAPFVFTGNALADQVLSDEIADEMLAGVDRIGLEGLAMTFDGLRVPLGFATPTVSLADYQGQTIAARPSAVTWATLRALGATPTDANGDDLSSGVQRGEIAAMEGTLGGETAPLASAFQTANAVLGFKANALVANAKTFDGLSGAQQDVLREAARATREWAAAGHGTEGEAVAAYCARSSGDIGLASAAQLAELRAATRSVLALIARDPVSRRALQRIEELSRDARPMEVTPCSAGSTPAPPTAPLAAVDDPSVIDGVWRVVMETKNMLGNESCPDWQAYANTGTWTLTFSSGAYSYVEPQGRFCEGRYVIDGSHIVMTETGPRDDCYGSTWSVSFERDGDTMRFGPPPDDPQSWVKQFFANPLHRIGAPPEDQQSLLDGTWRLDSRAADMLAAGATSEYANANAGVRTFHLRRGRGTVDQPQGDPCIIAYAIHDDRISIDFGASSSSGCGGWVIGTVELRDGMAWVRLTKADEGPLAANNAFFRRGLVRVSDTP
ncbi:MAG: TRAP transporter substrate-binding protein [Gaiella sp.]